MINTNVRENDLYDFGPSTVRQSRPLPILHVNPFIRNIPPRGERGLTLLKLPLDSQHRRGRLPSLRLRPRIQYIRIKHPFIRFRQWMTRRRDFRPKLDHFIWLRGRLERLHALRNARGVSQEISAGKGGVRSKWCCARSSVLGSIENLGGVRVGRDGVGGYGECGRGGVGGYERGAVGVP